jgi:hypothetical protein
MFNSNNEIPLNYSNSKVEDIEIYLITINMNGKEINQNLISQLIPKNKDIYVISTQESHKSISDAVIEFLGEYYILISNPVLWGIRLLVISKFNHILKITNIEESTKATGFLKVCGNKGGLSVSFQFNETSLCFIGSHLSAHTEKLQQRNLNVYEIVDKLEFGRI